MLLGLKLVARTERCGSAGAGGLLSPVPKRSEGSLPIGHGFGWTEILAVRALKSFGPPGDLPRRLGRRPNSQLTPEGMD
jgi:hypothetical protein